MAKMDQQHPAKDQPLGPIPVELQLVQLYAEVLSVPEDQVRPDDSFIALGGDSFKALRLKRECDHRGIRLSLRDVLNRKTIAAIVASQGTDNAPKKVRKKRQRKGGKGQDDTIQERFPLMPVGYSWDEILRGIGHPSWNEVALAKVEVVYPCSPMQEGMHVARETTGKQLYRIHALLELGPSITIDALDEAWQSVVDRHQSLRTVFVPSTDASRLLDALVLKTFASMAERVDCRDNEAVLASYRESCTNPPEFSPGPPHRLIAYLTQDGHRFCTFDQSHMISDGTSLLNMINELCALLNGLPLEEPAGYSKFVEYTQQEQDLDEGLSYWKSYLSGAQPCIFPTLRPAQGPNLEEYQVIEFSFHRQTELRKFCTGTETTVSTALQAAWAVLLRAYTRTDEVLFGYTSSGRDLPLQGGDSICGPLVNLVMRRVDLASKSVKAVLEGVQKDWAEASSFQDVPFMQVQQIMGPEVKQFNSIMTIQYAPMLVDEGDKPLMLRGNFNASEFGLSVQVMYSEERMKMQLTYQTDLLSPAMAERVTETYLAILERLLDGGVERPVGEVQLISEMDEMTVFGWNDKTLRMKEPLVQATVHGLIAETAARTPLAPAVYFSGETLTYKDLDGVSTRLADTLLRCMDPDQRYVPLLFEKSPLYSIALLAVMKCGRAFVPIDVNNPPGRIQALLEQLGITSTKGLVVCSETQAERLRQLYDFILVPKLDILKLDTASNTASVPISLPSVQPSAPAYVIFTSGSTGEPKGVIVSHAAYAHAARTHASGICISHSSRVLQFASYAFDTSMEDHLTTFIVGACLCVPTEMERESSLVEFINSSGANWWHITPSMADMVSPEEVPGLKTMVLGGEAMTARNVREWAVQGRRLVQVYGPSECAVTSTINSDVSVRMDPTEIGMAFDGCAAWVTDSNDPNVFSPIGAVGELLMEGPILAEGYLGNKSATAAAFVTSLRWAPCKRLYRTGDLVRYDEEGRLHFVGRADSRVKIRGQRIECGEIENQLVVHGSVLHAVVVVPKKGPGAEHLTAVVSLKGVSESTNEVQLVDWEHGKVSEETKSLRDWLGDRLPAYMVPEPFIFVRHMPMNASRKLDRRRVLQFVEGMDEEVYRGLVRGMDGPEQEREGTEMERKVKTAWCHVLNVSDADVHWSTSWFSSGGDSISAMMLSSHLRKQSLNIAAADILRLRNIERIAARIEENVSNSMDSKFRDIDLAGMMDQPWGMSPIQQLSFQFFEEGDFLDQQTMVVDTTLKVSDRDIAAALNAVVKAHPMLLARFSKSGHEWTQRVDSTSRAEEAYLLRPHKNMDTPSKLECIADTKRGIDIVHGPLMGVDIFRSTDSTTLSITIHHLAVDLVSWRVIFQDLEDMLVHGQSIQPEPTTFQSWCQVQRIYSQNISPVEVLPGDIDVDLDYWGMQNEPNSFGDAIAASVHLKDTEMTGLLAACDKLDFDLVDVVSAAITTAFSNTFPPRTSPAVFLEGHGREPPSTSIDLSRTVGWFTTLTPVSGQLPTDTESSSISTLRQIKQFREKTPLRGLDYFTSRFFHPDGVQQFAQRHLRAEIVLNVLGAYQQFERADSVFKKCDDAALVSGLGELRREQRKESERYALVTILVGQERGALSIEIEWNKRMKFQKELALWPDQIRDGLLKLTEDLAALSALPTASITKSEIMCFGVNKEKTLQEVSRLGLSSDVEGIYPCSPMQQGLMASLLRDPATSAYHQTFLLEVQSPDGQPVNSERLAEIWVEVVRKHSILRTVFVESEAGEYAQVVLREAVPVVTIREGLEKHEVEAELYESENSLLKSPFQGSPLHRLAICQTSDGTYILLTKSHLLTDGMSTQILIRDIINGCDGVSEESWTPQNQFLDYVQYVSRQDLDEARRYWAAYLEGSGTCNFPKLLYGQDNSNAYATASLQLSEDDVLKKFCRDHDVTPSNVFQLAWALVLKVYLNTDDILFGFLSSGRDLPVEGIENAVGPVANLLPVRSELSRDKTVLEAVTALQTGYIEHISRQTLSLAEIRHAGRKGTQVPDFNSILNVQKAGREEGRHTVELVKGKDTTEYAIAVTISDTAGGYKLSVEYETSLMSAQDAESVVEALATAVQNISAQPHSHIGDIELVGEKDRKQIQAWDTVELETRDECVHDLFRVTAQSIPDKEAIHAWDGSLTYKELDALSEKIAYTLISLSIQPEEIVPLCFEKSVWGIVAMLGVTKAGAAFVHLDPASPLLRKQQIIKLTAPRFALSSPLHRSLIESLVPKTWTISREAIASLPDAPTTASPRTVGSSNAIYTIFTSGSTGEPKGVVIEHRHFSSAMHANRTWLRILPHARILQFSSFVFDACMEEIYTALVAGATVCVPSDEQRMSPEGLTSFIKDAGVSWAALTPSLLQTLDPDVLVPGLEFVTVHAEPMNEALMKSWSGRVEMRPSYGPTECTVTSTVGGAFTAESDPLNIGWPVGCRARVTDPADPQRLVPVGAVGELVLEGPILGRGYLNREDETAKAFPKVRDWFDGGEKRVYRTGDLVRYIRDGSLRILGRRDTQVKVRGQRVELGEVKSQIDLADGVLHSLVLQPGSGLLKSRLVAVVSLMQVEQKSKTSAIQLLTDEVFSTKEGGHSLAETLSEIRGFVSSRLPSYMIPHTWFVVEDVPTLPSLKLDRKMVSRWVEEVDEETLLAARKDMSTSSGSQHGTGSKAEELVRAAWSDVLGMPGGLIDVDDHFIALGGDSISAMHVARFLSRAGSPVKTQDILRSNSIRELASVIEASHGKIEPEKPIANGVQPLALPSTEEIRSLYGSEDAAAEIVSVHRATPFQSRAALGLYKSSLRPYLYTLFAEVQGYENVDPAKLQAAWLATVSRHEILRTAVLVLQDGNTCQVVLDVSSSQCNMVKVGTEAEALEASVAKIEKIRVSLSEKPLVPPLWLTLYATPTGQVYFHLLMGHMLVDNVSIAHIYHDWDAAYRSSLSTDGSACIPQFWSYVQHVSKRNIRSSTEFWTQKLQGQRPTILPTFATAGSSSTGPSIVKFQIPVDDNVHTFCRAARVTVSTLLHFAWAILLGRYTAQDSVCFGHVVSDRDIDLPGVDEIVGPMLSVLVTRVHLQGNAEETIQKVQHDNTAGMAHRVFDLTAVERRLGLHPPASVLFNTILNYRKVRREGPGPVMKLKRILEQDTYEQQILLSFNDAGNKTGLDAAITFREGVHSEESVRRMAGEYAEIIRLVVGGGRTVEELISYQGVVNGGPVQ